MSHEIALSTMWAAGRFNTLSAFFAAAYALGFHCFELNYQVTPVMLQELQPGQEEIVSVHHPCPATIDEKTMQREDMLLSSLNPARRARAVTLVKQTIDLAQTLGASIVVLHPGQVNLNNGLEASLRELYRQGRRGTEGYETLRQRLVATREAKAQPHFQVLFESLHKLSQYAERRGLKIGLETPFNYYQIPTLQEMKALLEALDENVVCYVHDVGHAQGRENLGFAGHEEWLRSFAPRMGAIHLHDIKGISGHSPVGTGEMDFAMVRKHLPSSVLKICEFRSKYSPQEVQAALETVRSWL
jgi:sugar phosphate isomerase/epimerase